MMSQKTEDRVFRERSAPLRAATLIGMFVGGIAVGQVLAHSLTPDTEIGAAMTFMMLPVSLCVGMICWLGMAILFGVASLLRRLASGRSRTPRAIRQHTTVLPGSFVFVPVTVGICTAAGILAGILSPGRGVLAAGAAHLVTGLLYGLALWQSARRGFLPFPEEGAPP
ncbi:MAG: hypothetical protein HYX75_16800 [Acidobacteria bacterium]|nr:hypothetical protein [Acidobacteriota bacterium]